MNTSDISDTDETERQREQVRLLCREKRYEEAARLTATLSDEVLIFTPCEDIADHVYERMPDAAARLYGIAIHLWTFEGTQATGSGEGIMAMDNLHRVEKKLEKLKLRSDEGENAMGNLKARLLGIVLIAVGVGLIYVNWRQLTNEGTYSLKLAAFAPVGVVGGIFLLLFPDKGGKPETTQDKITVLAVFGIGLAAGLFNWYLMDPHFFGK